jgi:hypothetical protein
MEICSQKLLATPCAAARLPWRTCSRWWIACFAKRLQCRLPDADAVLGLIGQRF